MEVYTEGHWSRLKIKYMRILQDLNFYKKLRLCYDYDNQAWVLDDKYLRCNK